MALVPQSDAGDEAGANAYGTLAEFKAYHDARGNSYTTTDSLVEQAIIKATDYIDQRFRFLGVRLNGTDQTTMWPRKAAANESTLLVDPDGNDIEGIVTALKNATAEYALRALSAALFQDAPAPSGGRAIDSLSQKVDIIEKSVTYSASASLGGFIMPAYPAADLILARAGLIASGRNIFR